MTHWTDNLADKVRSTPPSILFRMAGYHRDRLLVRRRLDPVRLSWPAPGAGSDPAASRDIRRHRGRGIADTHRTPTHAPTSFSALTGCDRLRHRLGARELIIANPVARRPNPEPLLRWRKPSLTGCGPGQDTAPNRGRLQNAAPLPIAEMIPYQPDTVDGTWKSQRSIVIRET